MTADKGSDQLSGYFLNGPMGQILSHRIRGFPLSIPPAGSQPQSLTVVKPDPRFRQYLAYIADNGTNKVSAYAVDGKCNFHDTIPGSPFKTGNGPTSLAIDPTIRFAYVVNEGDNNIWEYRIHGNGSLTKFGSQTLSGAAPVGIVIH
jgi:6-phosphogluconolactonase (cycloisomerase 2 family)